MEVEKLEVPNLVECLCGLPHTDTGGAPLPELRAASWRRHPFSNSHPPHLRDSRRLVQPWSPSASRMPYPMAYCSIITDRTQLVLTEDGDPPALVHSMLLQNKLTSFTPWANLSLLSLRYFEISCQRFSQFQTRCCSKTPTSTPCWQVCGISPWMPESFFPSLVLLLFSLS